MSGLKGKIRNVRLRILCFDCGMKPVPYAIDHKNYQVDLLNSLPLETKQAMHHIIADRVLFLRDSVAELNTLIQEREELKNALNADIEQNLAATKEALYEELNLMASTERRSSLERLIAQQQREKRDRETEFWSDKFSAKLEQIKAEKELRNALLDLWMVRFLS